MKKIFFITLLLALGLAASAQIADHRDNTPGMNFQKKQTFPHEPVNKNCSFPLESNPVRSTNAVKTSIAGIVRDSPFVTTFDPTWANRFQTVLDSAVLATGVKGASLAILVPGQGLWTGVSGFSSAGVPITREMRFGIASNTKLFTAVTLEKLQEQGVLSLDDHLYQWLPSYPNVDSSTTIRQLLSHQSGLLTWDNDAMITDSVWADTSRFWTPQEILATIGSPYYEPGNGYNYSNTNYTLAGMVIEAATGINWVQKMHDLIFDPEEMDSSFVGAFESRNGPVAHEWDYFHNNVEIINSPMTAVYSMVDAAGAVFSTPQEMAEWYSALFSGGAIVSDSSLQEVLNFDPSSDYGLGIGEYMVNGTHFCYTHEGAMLGYLSQMVFDVQTKSVLCVMTNQRTDFYSLLIPLVNVLFNEYPKQQNDAGITKIVTPWENSCSTIIIPSVMLANFGSTPLTSADIKYKIDGETPATFNWIGALNPGGTINVILPEITTGPGYHKFTCFTSLPNGAQEGYTYNDTTKSNFIITAIPSEISEVDESFDGNVFPPAGWAENSSSIYKWGRTSLARFSGTASAVNPNYNDFEVGTHYDLDLPLIHITDQILSFQYAYAMYPGNRGDSLQVFISTDCGATWQTLFNKGGVALHTASNTYSPFYPQTSAQWKEESFSLAEFPGDVLIRFRDVCGNSNNLFLDDVKVDFPTATAENKPPENFIVYPNPAYDVINVSGLPVNSDVRIMDLTGKQMIMQKTSNTITTINIQNLQQGVYILWTNLGIRKMVKI